MEVELDSVAAPLAATAKRVVVRVALVAGLLWTAGVVAFIWGTLHVASSIHAAAAEIQRQAGGSTGQGWRLEVK